MSRAVPFSTARPTAYEYVIFRGRLHKRNTRNKKRAWYNRSWSMYVPSLGTWKPEYNVDHFDFSPSDYVTVKVAYAFKEQLDKKYEEEIKREDAIENMLGKNIEYVAKAGGLYRRDLDDNLNKVPWYRYDPISMTWKEDYNKHDEFSSYDILTTSQAISLQNQLDAQAHPENKKDFSGKYVYFEGSNNLYRVLNSKLEAELYMGNGNWSNRGNKLTQVGVTNNTIPDAEAERRMMLMDNATTVTTEPEEKDFTGAYFTSGERLLKAVELQKNPKFKRYRCNKYIGEGQWEHVGFYSPESILKHRISPEEAEKIMNDKDLKKGCYKDRPLQEEPKELEADKIKLNTVSPVVHEKPKREVRIGSSFIINGVLGKVTCIYHKNSIAFADYYNEKERRFKHSEVPEKLETIRDFMVSDKEALDFITDVLMKSKASPVENKEPEVKVGSYFTTKGALFRVTEVNEKDNYVASEYKAGKDFSDHKERYTINQVRAWLVSEEVAKASMEQRPIKASVGSYAIVHGALYRIKQILTNGFYTDMWSSDLCVWSLTCVWKSKEIESCLVHEYEARRYVRKSCETMLKRSVSEEELAKYFLGIVEPEVINEPAGPLITGTVSRDVCTGGDLTDVIDPKLPDNAELKTVVDKRLDAYVPQYKPHGAATGRTEPKKCMVVKVPVTITSGATITVWVEGALRQCYVENIIFPGDHNIAVEGYRAESIAEIFEEAKAHQISKEKVTDLILDKLEENYIKLKFTIDNKDKYLYLSRKQLEKQLEVVRSIS